MKGTLDRTLKGWEVKYFDFHKSHDIMYCGESLPLHPEDVSLSIAYSDYSTDWIGKEVEFEIINESWEGYMGGTYAKLVSKEVKGGESETFKEDETEKLADEFYKDANISSELKGIIISATKGGFVNGYKKCKETYKFTEEDLRNAFMEGVSITGEGYNAEYCDGNCPDLETEFGDRANEYIQSIKK